MKKQSEFVYSKENDHLPMYGVGPIYVWCIVIVTLLTMKHTEEKWLKEGRDGERAIIDDIKACYNGLFMQSRNGVT